METWDEVIGKELSTIKTLFPVHLPSGIVKEILKLAWGDFHLHLSRRYQPKPTCRCGTTANFFLIRKDVMYCLCGPCAGGNVNIPTPFKRRRHIYMKHADKDRFKKRNKTK